MSRPDVTSNGAIAHQTREHVCSQAQVDEFTYAVAHDFKESLRTISMFTELLAKEVELDGKGIHLAKFIVEGVARMTALFDGLHALAISGSDELPKRVDLGKVADDVLQDLVHAVVTNNAFVIVDPLPVVWGNEKHLQRVLQNLIANAIKYHGDRQIEIRLHAEQLEKYWVIKVTDNGRGIAREHQELIFLPLKRLHGTEIPGAGIGLAVCKKLVGAMGGSIWVESAIGSGSIFSFTIPSATGTVDGNSILSSVRRPDGGSGLHETTFETLTVPATTRISKG